MISDLQSLIEFPSFYFVFIITFKTSPSLFPLTLQNVFDASTNGQLIIFAFVCCRWIVMSFMIISFGFWFFIHLWLVLKFCASIDICLRIYMNHFWKSSSKVWFCTWNLKPFCRGFNSDYGQMHTRNEGNITNLLKGQKPFSYQNLHF